MLSIYLSVNLNSPDLLLEEVKRAAWIMSLTLPLIFSFPSTIGADWDGNNIEAEYPSLSDFGGLQ